MKPQLQPSEIAGVRDAARDGLEMQWYGVTDKPCGLIVSYVACTFNHGREHRLFSSGGEGSFLELWEQAKAVYKEALCQPK